MEGLIFGILRYVNNRPEKKFTLLRFERTSIFFHFMFLLACYASSDRAKIFLASYHVRQKSSLRSKRFQSSYRAKFGAGAKKKWKVPSLPSPFIPFFALVPVFSTNSRGTACYAG